MSEAIYLNEGGCELTFYCGGFGCDVESLHVAIYGVNLVPETIRRAFRRHAEEQEERMWTFHEGIAWCPDCWANISSEAFIEHARIERLLHA